MFAVRGRAVPPVFFLATILVLLPTVAAGSMPSTATPAIPPQAAPSTPAGKADSNRNKIFDDLEELLTTPVAAASPDAEAEVPVLVAFSRDLSDSEVSVLLSIAARPTPRYRYRSVPGMALAVPRAAVPGLAASPLVKHLELDGRVRAAQGPTYWFGVQAARDTFGVNGDGDGSPMSFSKNDVVVAVVDSGIDANHPDLQGKVLGWLDLVSGIGTPYDNYGHGTHVAGIVAGTGAGNSQYVGVAPGAALVGIKVLDSTGNGDDSNVVAALDWAIAHKADYGIEIVNLSLGGESNSDGTDLLSQAVDRAVAQGLVVVVAAGNAGPGAGSVRYPGTAAGAITVGAMADPGVGGLHLAGFSGRGPTLDDRVKPDLVAPGVGVTAPWRGGGYATLQGTSMATPFVAGVAALMLAANPTLTPAQIKSRLTGTAVDWGQSGPDNEYGFGKLDGYAAVAAAMDSGGTNPVEPLHTAFAGSLAGRGVDWYTLSPTAGSLPVAATLINGDWSSGAPKLSLALLDPDGIAVARSPSLFGSVYNNQEHRRQETVSSLGLSGTLRLAVYSLAGAGSYALDISGASATKDPTQVIPTPTPTPAGWTVLFSDDAESGAGDPPQGPWVADPPWAISNLDFKSPTHAWAQSPYLNEADASLTSRAISLAGVADPRLRFWARYELEQGADSVYLEISRDGGTSYEPIDPIGGGGEFTGISPSWRQFSFSLANQVGQQVRLRFRLASDGSEVGDGWWLDDVAVEGLLSATPTLTPSATPTATVSPTSTATATPTSTATATATPSPTASATPSPTSTGTPPPGPTPTATSGPGATLLGRVSLQRPIGSGEASRRIPVQVSAFEPGTGSTSRVLRGSTTAEADPGGLFTAVLPVGAGYYDVSVKGFHTLGRLLPSQSLPTGGPVEFGLLLEGDVTGDNRVDISDFVAAATAFGLLSGQQGFPAGADLSHDSLIDIADFSLLAGNFNLAGDLPAP